MNEELRRRLLNSCILHVGSGGTDGHAANGLKNIILIGMPGCGKSTISRILSRDHGFKTIDVDEEFQKTYGITPAECITEFGEPEFRRRESEVLARLKPGGRACIATGGGAVTVPGNVTLLRLEQPLNEDAPRRLTAHGIFTVANLPQFLKTLSWIQVIDSGRETFFKRVQSTNM